MPKRTSPTDAMAVIDAADIDVVVKDKREGWRASELTARRQDRRYKNLLTREIRKMGGSTPQPDDDDDVALPSCRRSQPRQPRPITALNGPPDLPSHRKKVSMSAKPAFRRYRLTNSA